MANGIENPKFTGHSSWLHDSPQIQLWTSAISRSSFFRLGGEKKMYEEVIVIKCVDSRLTPTLFNSYLPDLKTIHPCFCVSGSTSVKQELLSKGYWEDWEGYLAQLVNKVVTVISLLVWVAMITVQGDVVAAYIIITSPHNWPKREVLSSLLDGVWLTCLTSWCRTWIPSRLINCRSHALSILRFIDSILTLYLIMQIRWLFAYLIR